MDKNVSKDNLKKEEAFEYLILESQRKLLKDLYRKELEKDKNSSSGDCKKYDGA